MENTMDLRGKIRSSLRSRKGNELTLAFNCQGYDLFFTATKGGIYLNAFFVGYKYPFAIINCWDYRYEKSGINDMIDFVNHIVDFIDDNVNDLPTYFANN